MASSRKDANRGSPAGPAASRRAQDGVEEKLTPREREVLYYLAQGLTNAQIGQKLYVSSHTVKNHITSIYRKLGVSDRVHATLVAIQSGLYRLE